MPSRARRIADIGSIDEEVRNRRQCHFAGVALGDSWPVASGASISTANALEVAGVSELVGGTLDCAFIHVEEVAQSVHALAGLADCGRSAEGAGGVALSALVVDGVGVLSGVAGRSAGRESDPQVG